MAPHRRRVCVGGMPRDFPELMCSVRVLFEGRAAMLPDFRGAIECKGKVGPNVLTEWSATQVNELEC